MSGDTTKISLRIPSDYAMWLQRQVDAKREKGYQSNLTDEIMACIVHRMVALMPPDKRRNLEAAMCGSGAISQKGEKQEDMNLPG